MPVLCLLFPRFPVQVALRQRPQLASRPFAILDGAGERSLVIAPSPAAAASGVLPGMDAGNARRRCPSALFLPSNIGACFAAIDAIVDILRLRTTPHVALGGHDHLFLDLESVAIDSVPLATAAARTAGLARMWSGFDVRAGTGATPEEALLAARAARRGIAAVPVEDQPGDGHQLFGPREPIRASIGLPAESGPAAVRAGVHRLLARLGTVLEARGESLRALEVHIEGDRGPASEVRHRPRNPVHVPLELMPALAARLDDAALAGATRITLEASGLVPYVPVAPIAAPVLAARPPRQLLRAG